MTILIVIGVALFVGGFLAAIAVLWLAASSIWTWPKDDV